MKAFGKIGVLLVLASLTLWACEGHHASGDKTTVSKVEKQDAELPRVVVKAFAAKGITDAEASGLASKFCVELSKKKGFNLLCAEDIRALFSHQGDQVMLGQCDSSDCLAKLAEKTKADKILQVVVSKVGEKFVISVSVVDGPSGTIKSRLTHELDSGALEDLLESMTPLATKVGELL